MYDHHSGHPPSTTSMGWGSVPNALVISHLPKRGKVEVWVFLKLGRAGWVDRLVAVPAGGCACWWLCLLQRLVAVLRGSRCDSLA